MKQNDLMPLLLKKRIERKIFEYIKVYLSVSIILKHIYMENLYVTLNYMYRGGSRDFEKGGTLCWPPWLTGEKKIRFQMV